MNDNVDENFLRNLLMKCGPTEEQIIYRHPRTQRRLGIARIVFVDVKSARSCIDKYNQQSVMGNVMNVFHDAFGEQCKQILAEASGEKKQQNSIPQPQPQPQPPSNLLKTQAVPSMPTFKQTDESTAPHTKESDAFYQVDYNNPYMRSGHIPPIEDTDEHRHYEVDDHRHYRYDKKGDSRRWESKSSRYYVKSEKDRDRRYRHDRDRDIGRRRDYDYERKDHRSRERDHRSRDSKYRDYKKSSERDYVLPADNSFTYGNIGSSSGSGSSSNYTMGSHHHSSHHYSSFDSACSSTFHSYPPLP